MVHFNKKFVECELLFDRVGLSQHHANGPSSFETMQKPVSSPILDRFSALLREREEELRDSEEEDGGGSVCMDEIVRIYEVVLSELTLNSKPLITELTIIAGEQRECAEGIADAICTRIIQVPAEHKLPSLYLLDSIVKNIGSEYVRYFASRLPEVFVKAYRQVHPNQHPAMRHLFGTWSAVFPSSVLRKIGIELHFSSLVNERPSGSASLRSPESPCPPTHGIHVNPKYLEARRQFEHATGMRTTDHQRAAAHMTSFKGEIMERNASASPDGWSGASPDFDEIHDARGISSNLHRHGQKPAVGHGEYDMDNAEIISQQVGIGRLGSPGIATRMSITGEQKFVPPNYSLLSSSSPSRVRLPESLSSSNDGYTVDNSPSRAAERASPLHSGFGYAADRLNKRGKEWEDSSAEHQVDNARPSVEMNLKSEFDRQRPRALIDAYGNYGRESKLNGSPLKIEPLVVSGINSDIATRRWQNNDEEEYLWEEMSPTLADRSRNNDLMPSNPTLQNTRLRSGFGRQNASITEPDYRMGYWPTQPRLPGLNDNPNFSEDASVLGSGLGDTGTKFMGGLGNQNNATMNRVSKYSREPWNLHQNFSQSSQLYPNVSGNAIQMSFPSTHTALSTGQRVSFPMDKAEGLSSMSSSVVANHFGQRPHSTHMASQRRSELDAFSLPLPSQRNQISGQFDVKDSNKPLVNQGANESSVLPQQQFDYFERKAGSLNKLFNQPTASTYLNNQTQGMVASVQPQVPKSLAHGSFVTPMSAQVPSPLLPQHFNRGHQIQGHGVLTSTMPSNRLSSLPPIPMYGIPSTSFQVQVGTKPPLPPGPPPSSQMGPSSQILGPVASHTNLFGSLMAQGLISLTAPAPVQDSVGVEFDSDILKVRHESVIKALYTDLPRQCKTCGLRFKCQEEHSTHMDWHVTKNRVSRKSKQKPSQKWFVTTSLWLSGAENVGTDAVPGFLPNESIIEKNDDEVTAVPADENQSACALCGEPFEDFYSDETEEWMYKGAVYLKAPDGLTAGMDRSQLGSIVHAKCRSESTMVSNDVSGVYEGGTSEDGNQPKRMRVE